MIDSDISLPDSQDSYWLEARLTATYPELTEEVTCDVAIVGGGIAGLTAAYLLKRAGLSVAVVEKHTIGSGTSGGTTGKVTTQHGLIYAELEKKWGKETTRQYAAISRDAFELQKKIIREEKIDCEWQTADNYVFTSDKTKVTHFEREAAAAARAGLPASFEAQSELPFPITGAVKFADQAHFHVMKYLQALAKLIDGQGSYVFEQSQAKHMKEGSPGRIATEHGAIIARHIIIATKIPAAPLVARLTYGFDEYPETSYIVAAKYAGGLQGMYISSDQQHYSLLPIDTIKGRLLLIGGENHIPGLGRPGARQHKLAAYGTRWFDIGEVKYRWKAMDYMAYDGLPVIGKLYPWSRNIYAITGFKKWGLNLSMVAGIVVRDLILERADPAMELFSPHRLSAPLAFPKTALNYLKQQL